MSALSLRRLGLIMEPEPGDPHKVEGTLNPGAVRGPDGCRPRGGTTENDKKTLRHKRGISAPARRS
jgi:hypothetical protein